MTLFRAGNIALLVGKVTLKDSFLFLLTINLAKYRPEEQSDSEDFHGSLRPRSLSIQFSECETSLVHLSTFSLTAESTGRIAIDVFKIERSSYNK